MSWRVSAAGWPRQQRRWPSIRDSPWSFCTERAAQCWSHGQCLAQLLEMPSDPQEGHIARDGSTRPMRTASVHVSVPLCLFQLKLQIRRNLANLCTHLFEAGERINGFEVLASKVCICAARIARQAEPANLVFCRPSSPRLSTFSDFFCCS